jgi:hypothetical protein
MNLDTFVTEALTQVLGGISAANEKIIGSQPSPNAARPFLLKHGGKKDEGSGIEFDLAVTVKSERGGKGSIKGKFLQVIEAEVGASGSIAHEQVSHIKFIVFVNQWQG